MARGKGSGEDRIELGFGEVFRGLGNFVDLLSRMMEEGQTEVSRTGELRGLGKARGVYGFSVRMGLGGLPRVEHFGNIRVGEEGPVVEEVREPLVDVFDEGPYLRIIAELPGVEREAIQWEAKGDILILTAQGKERKYAKELLLPCPVKAEGIESSYQNGILELKLPKF